MHKPFAKHKCIGLVFDYIKGRYVPNIKNGEKAWEEGKTEKPKEMVELWQERKRNQRKRERKRKTKGRK
jgi:hypothetical protein